MFGEVPVTVNEKKKTTGLSASRGGKLEGTSLSEEKSAVRIYSVTVYANLLFIYVHGQFTLVVLLAGLRLCADKTSDRSLTAQQTNLIINELGKHVINLHVDD